MQTKTIVSTSLPTITNDLHADHDQYTWVGIAYMLTQTACQPLYGRISDLVGRKVPLYRSDAVVLLIYLLEHFVDEYGRLRHWFFTLWFRAGTPHSQFMCSRL